MSDARYDFLRARVGTPQEALEAEPTWGKVGAHSFPVQTIRGERNPSRVLAWLQRRRAEKVLVQPKVDGVNVTAYVRNGRVASALTRGNGKLGNEVLPRLTSLSRAWLGDYTGVLKLEAYVGAGSSGSYATARNMAAGLLSQKEVRREGLGALRLALLDSYPALVQPAPALEALPTRAATLRELERDGLQPLAEEVMAAGYPIDGLVLKVPGWEPGTGAERSDCIAWKFYEPEAETEAVSVEWEVGRQGAVVPVLKVKPCQLDGSEIERISMHNWAALQASAVGPGSRVRVRKAGLIIPQVVKAEPSPSPFARPLGCPSCRSPLLGKGPALLCPSPFCPGKLRAYLDYAFSKVCLNVKGLTGAMVLPMLTGERALPEGLLDAMLSGRLTAKLLASPGLRFRKAAGRLEAALGSLGIGQALMLANISSLSARAAAKLTELLPGPRELGALRTATDLPEVGNKHAKAGLAHLVPSRTFLKLVALLLIRGRH